MPIGYRRLRLDQQASGSGAAAPRTIEVFYSYAREDEAFVRQLEKQLAVLRRMGVVTTWHDRRIEPGSPWQQQIDAHLAAARVIVLMISSDFINSDYCWEKEVQVAMQRHALGTAVVVPIVLRDTAFLDKTPFGHLQMLPQDAVPVAQWPHPDQVWASIAKALGNVCLDMQHRDIFEADAKQAGQVLAGIAAAAQRQRAEREQIMQDLQRHILNDASPAQPPRPAVKRASAAFDNFDRYIRSGDKQDPPPKSG
jgi:hypothetical protein